MRNIITIFLLNIILINKSFALIEVDITRGNLDPLPIAISPLHVDIKSENIDDIKIKRLGEDIYVEARLTCGFRSPKNKNEGLSDNRLCLHTED